MDYTVQHETVGDRLQVIARPLTLPGCCAVCGYNGTNVSDPTDIRVFLDFQLDIDYYGRVYFCSGCLLQAANTLGWLSVKQADELRDRVQAQESELIVLREQNERLRAALVNLLGSTDGVIPGDDFPAHQNVGEGVESSQGTVNSSEQEQLAFDESSREQGSDSIPTVAGSDSIGGFAL